MKRFLFLTVLSAFCLGAFAQQKLPAPEAVAMYEINPRVFAPKNSFRAIAARLDSIHELGINVVWFMPIYETGKLKAKGSPYCVRNYEAVNPEFGTMADFKKLVALCHQKGMSVLLDWVANHTSWDNVWMAAHKDWYTQDAKGRVISPAGTGWNDVADLNFSNRQMRLAMIRAMRFWVEKADVDGFRCDAADYVHFDFWKQALDSLRAIPHHRLLMLAEGQREDHFKAGFDMNYAWGFLGALRRVYGRRQAPASLLFRADSLEYSHIPAGKCKLRFITNHDEAAGISPVKAFGGRNGSVAAFVATTYLHGGLLIYGSQEVGYPERINFFRYCPVDWNARPALRDEYARLIQFYDAHPCIRRAPYKEYPEADVLLFEKRDAQDDYLVAVNLRDRQETAALPEGWVGCTLHDVFGHSRLTPSDYLRLPAFAYLVLRKE